MSSIKAPHEMTNLSPDELQKHVEILGDDLVRTINGKLDFQTNFNAKAVSAVFTAASTDTAVVHGLGRVPIGYLKTSQSVAMSVFNGTTRWTATTIYLQSSVAGTAGLLIY